MGDLARKGRFNHGKHSNEGVSKGLDCFRVGGKGQKEVTRYKESYFASFVASLTLFASIS